MVNKIYLAGRYARRDELRGYAEQLRAAGFGISASWLDETEFPLDVRVEDIPQKDNVRMANRDLQDIRRSGVFIAFTEGPSDPHIRGGRHVELGYAIAHHLQVYLVGPRENIFCYLLEQFDTFEQLLAHLKEDPHEGRKYRFC